MDAPSCPDEKDTRKILLREKTFVISDGLSQDDVEQQTANNREQNESTKKSAILFIPFEKDHAKTPKIPNFLKRSRPDISSKRKCSSALVRGEKKLKTGKENLEKTTKMRTAKERISTSNLSGTESLVSDGGNATAPRKMSCKGRVKDLVEKLNNGINPDIQVCKELEEYNHQSPTFEHQFEVKPVIKDVVLNKRKLSDSKIPNKKHTSLHTKTEFTPDKKNNDELKNANQNCKSNNDASENNSWTEMVGTDTLYKLLSEKHTALQQAHHQLQKKYSKECKRRQTLENEIQICRETVANNEKDDVLMLKKHEQQLLTDIQELKEQNELLEFRLLELDYDNVQKQQNEQSCATINEGTERDDVSDSGVMSLSPCEDFYSEYDIQDIKLDEEEPRTTGTEVQQKLMKMYQSVDNTSEKVTIQQAIDLIKHYQMRLTGMETTLMNMCQERMEQNSDEFLTSLKNPDESYRKADRVVATVPPFQPESEKLLLEMDRLQESGIFDEFPDYGFGARAEPEYTGLFEELDKLTQIKRRIEEQQQFDECGKDVRHCKELNFYKEQYDILRSKVLAYEASDDLRMKQLTGRLQKEFELQNRVKYLTNKIEKVESQMKKLEEEKCEFEEAENDTRLRCQKLEVKLYALAEKKNDLQFQLQQQIRTVTSLRNTISELELRKRELDDKNQSLEALVNEYEERNFELEERELDTRHRLQMLILAIPSLIVFNVYPFVKIAEHIAYSCFVRKPKRCLTFPMDSPDRSIEEELRQKDDLIQTLKEYECDMRKRIFDLEETVRYYQELSTPKVSSRIQELEMKEQIYVQTLQQADDMINSMEREFTGKLSDMENLLLDKQWKLEECERKLNSFLITRETENQLMEKLQMYELDVNMLKQTLKLKDEEKLQYIEKEADMKEILESLSAQLQQSKDREEHVKQKLENERNVVKELRNDLEFKDAEFTDNESTRVEQIKQLQNKIQHLTRDVENHEVTNSELKEEVETLENTVYELNMALSRVTDEREKMLVMYRQELATKQQEIDTLQRQSYDKSAISTAQEISLVHSMKPPISEKPSRLATLPKIVLKKFEPCPFTQKNKTLNGKEATSPVRQEPYAHVIRHKDSYSVLLKPLPTENYSNFKVFVNDHDLRNTHQCISSLPEGSFDRPAISLTIRPA